MAVARFVTEDQNSATFDHLRRTVNTLVFMLANMGASVTAGATAEVIMSTISEGIAAGVDNNPAGTALVVVTNRPIELLAPICTGTPKKPQGSTKVVLVTDTAYKNL